LQFDCELEKLDVNPKQSQRCLIAFFNTTSGRFRWWDRFPDEVRSRLTAGGVDCHYFYKSRSGSSIFAPDEIGLVPLGDGNGALNDEQWLLANVWPIMQNYRQVIINTNSYHAPFAFRKLILRHGNAVWVDTIHRCPDVEGNLLTRLYKRLLRRLHFLPDWYVGVSHATAEYIRTNFGADRIVTIYNGIDLPEESARRDPDAFDPQRRKRYLFINRLAAGKGVELLVDAARRRLVEDPGFHLTIAGDGPLQADVERFLDEVQAENVRFVGFCNDVDSLYRNHDVLLMPYTRPQGLSLISLEARAFGLPAIYSGLGGVAETRDETNGISLSELSGSALADATRAIEKTDGFPNLIRGCYQGLDRFDIKTMTAEYEAFYDRLFGELSD
jgi:glycosyltransferase involved in cell wall biosynthesis